LLPSSHSKNLKSALKHMYHDVYVADAFTCVVILFGGLRLANCAIGLLAHLAIQIHFAHFDLDNSLWSMFSHSCDILV
jgi:hypothetical protein